MKKPLLNHYANKIINFHPSILPAFPGLNAIDQALNSSVQLLGHTAHFIDENVDTGPTILQSVISRTSVKCYDDVLDPQLNMLEKIWKYLSEDKIVFHEGKVQIIGAVTFPPFFSN